MHHRHVPVHVCTISIYPYQSGEQQLETTDVHFVDTNNFRIVEERRLNQAAGRFFSNNAPQVRKVTSLPDSHEFLGKLKVNILCSL